MGTFIINNFKCFKHIEIQTKNLTVFAGANGNGKSTVIQAFLLLRSTYENTVHFNEKVDIQSYPMINLNDDYCLNLGESQNIQNQNSEPRNVKFAFSDDLNDRFWAEYEFLENNPLALKPTAINKEGNCSIASNTFYYLNAERLGPRVKQDIKHLNYLNVGNKGEYTAQILGDSEIALRFRVEDSRVFPNSKNTRILSQVNDWLEFILPGVKIESVYSPDTLSAQIKVNNKYSKNSSVLSTNIGFGISYVLPIIVNGLIADKGSMLIVENPEAHLHPSAQSRIGQFLSVIANSGVKVVIETHSEHVIHGIQLATIRGEIEKENVIINFFTEEDDNQPAVKQISLNEKSELSEWPSGFFDQSQRDFAELLKFRRNG